MPRYRQAGLAISPMARLRGYRTPHENAAGTRALGGRIFIQRASQALSAIGTSTALWLPRLATQLTVGWSPVVLRKSP
jgi:hypothetical protein